MHDGRFHLVETLFEVDAMKFVHEKANRALLHAVNRLVFTHEVVQRLQHEPIAAKRDDDIGCFRVYRSVARDEAGPRRICLWCAGGQKSDSLEATFGYLVRLHAVDPGPRNVLIGAHRACRKDIAQTITSGRSPARRSWELA